MTAQRRPGYAPALDGVRGLFMLFFMAYHLGFHALEGIWIAINLFFTLSAFLIVRLLVAEHSRYGDVDVKAFYIRRVRRLLPALLTLIAFVALWWGVLGDADSRRRIGGDILATLGYVMNWRLVAEGDQYFGTAGGASPLRHAWTLAIEEQFYVRVPFLVMALLAAFRRRRNLAVLALLLGAVLSALWTAVLGFHDASDYPRLYYGTDTRAQALFLGAALGLWMAPDRRGRTPRALDPRLVLGLGLVGFFAMLLAPVLIDAYTGWMFNAGGMLLFGLTSLGLVYACVDPQRNPLQTFLSWRPLTHTGRLSYALYLWHWPIALILEKAFGGLGVASVVVGTVVTYAIAHVSYTSLVRPIIKHGTRGVLPRVRRKNLAAVALVPVVATACVGVALAATAPPAVDPAGDQHQAAPGPVQKLLDDQVDYVPGKPERVGGYGDSVPFFMVERFPKDAFPGVTLDNFGREGCDILAEPMSWAEGFSMGNEPLCTELKETWPQKFEENGDDVLLIFMSPLLAVPHVVDGERLWLDDPAYRKVITGRLDTLRKEAKGAGAEQVQLVNVPCRKPVPQSIPEEFRVVFEQSTHIVEEYKEPKRINALIDGWAKKHKDVEVIDLHQALCSDGYPEEMNGVQIYNDFLHFSPEATPMLWTWILGQVSEKYAEAP